MTHHRNVILIGTVGAVDLAHETDGHRVALARLDTPAGPHLVLIRYQAGRRAALAWKRGDRVTVWGWQRHVTDDTGRAYPVIHAHHVRKHHPGQDPPHPLEPEYRRPPRRFTSIHHPWTHEDPSP